MNSMKKLVKILYVYSFIIAALIFIDIIYWWLY